MRCPVEAKFRSDLGAIYQQAGRLDEAEVQLRASIGLDAGNSVALNNLAVTLVSLGKAEDAAPVYEEALAVARRTTSPYSYGPL